MNKRCRVAIAVALTFVGAAHGQDTPEFPCASLEDYRLALELAGTVSALEPPPFHRTRHPDAQWFDEAGFGLFIHWGIHSVAGVQPSWAMIKDYPYGGELYPPERYYALAEQFDPAHYAPDAWMAAAKRAGFQYAVLTTKHHDGYTLWPSAYGDMGTRQYMHGRDLLAPYVAACRKHGLKVGFYFSPRDWRFTTGDPPRRYPMHFDHNQRDAPKELGEPEQNRRDFEQFYAYTIGQLHELLTRYGTIDLLWFDGMGWAGIEDTHERETLAWIRSLQPGIVLNDRWGRLGDYTTPEWAFPKGPPAGWWENCISWKGHWGFDPKAPYRTANWVIDRLVRARAWGGNLLLNIGPRPDGAMPKGFNERCEKLGAWMDYFEKSVIGADMGPGEARTEYPVTTRGDVWYVHLPVPPKTLELRYVDKPRSVVRLKTGAALPVSYEPGLLRVKLPPEMDNLEAVAVTMPENRWETAVERFEERDQESPPPQDAILFTGSSSIRMWDLNRYFPDLDTINRGFGGSQYGDVWRFAERLIAPCHPRQIVLYVGDNDIAAGRSPEWVQADFDALIARIRHIAPGVPVVVLSIKPSLARWSMWEDMHRANEIMRAACEAHDTLTFVDMATPLLNDGTPREDVFLEDGLHLNDTGYTIWTETLRPFLK